MKKYILILLFTLFYTVSYSQQQEGKQPIKLPEITFPIEIISVKIENKPPLQPPERLTIDEEVDIKLFVEDFPPIPPYDVAPPNIPLQKPSTFLGIPEENALMSGAIDDYNNGRYISAKEKLEKLISKYPNVPFIVDAYYLLGLSYYHLGEKGKAQEYFEKGCLSGVQSLSRDYACISATILNLQLYNTEKAQELLKNVGKVDENTLLWHGTILAQMGKPKEAYSLIKDIKCENLDVNFVDYCRYLKSYLLFANKRYKEALQYASKVENPTYLKHILLLKGFAYLSLGELDKAEENLKKFLQGYSTVEKISDYAIYGLGVVYLKKGEVEKAIETAGILEARDKTLAQNLYIQIAQELTKKGKFKLAFLILQKSAQTGNRYIDYLKKKIAITAYNTGNYQYAYLMFKDMNSPLFDLYAGFSLLKMGKLSQAKDYFEKVVRLSTDPKLRKTALLYLSDIYFQLKDFKNYLLTVEQLKEYDPDTASDLLGWYFFVKKDYKRAYLSFKDPYMKAVSAFNAGLLKEAKELAQRLNTRKAKFLMAYIHLKEGDIEGAREILKQLAKYNDGIGLQAGYLYAYSFFSQQDFERAVEEFGRFARKHPNTKLGKQAILRMADAYYNMGNIEKAREIYRQFIQKYANSPEAIDAAYQLTVLEMRGSQGDIAQQIESFIQEYPNYPFVNLLKLQLADYYLSQKEYDKAEGLYKQLIQEDTKESEYAFYKLGYLYYLKGDYQQAIQVLNNFIQMYPTGELSITAKTLLAKIYEEQGDIDRAIQILQQLPDTDENRYRLAVLYFKKKDYIQAKSYFEDLYTRFPKYRNDIAYYLAKIQLELGHTDMAVKYLEEAIAGQDYYHVAESYYLLGLLNEKEGNLDKALSYYINVIYLYPEAKETVIKARIRAAGIMRAKGQRREASCMLKPLLEKELPPKLEAKVKRLKKSLPECR
ncbi:MAG: tetratricopeptide repeat protein [Aquificae bacterium]|nr:tetratricopeptide repeat protein [Aquificota bacterium]